MQMPDDPVQGDRLSAIMFAVRLKTSGYLTYDCPNAGPDEKIRRCSEIMKEANSVTGKLPDACNRFTQSLVFWIHPSRMV